MVDVRCAPEQQEMAPVRRSVKNTILNYVFDCFQLFYMYDIVGFLTTSWKMTLNIQMPD